jgi:ABC-type proline/glycine betaine transport system ATPase subunit
MTAVRFDNVSIVFGDKPENALALADQGKTRDEIGADRPRARRRRRLARRSRKAKSSS